MKVALLHRYPADRIKETNAAFPYLQARGIDVLTFKKFNRLNAWSKFFKSLLWIFYAPLLVAGKGYDVIYCDDSFPFYPALVRLASPKSEIVYRVGDLHLMYYTSGLVYKIVHWLEVKAWRACNLIIVISDAMEDYFLEQGFYTHVVLDPVDLTCFMPANLKTSKKIVMFHGLLTRNKNVDILIEAAKRLPGIEFWVVGDGPDKKRLLKIAPKNVIFKRWVAHKWMYVLINQCDIGVALRSSNPGNEYVVTSPYLQYGAMGKPCLVTRRKVFGDYRWQFSSVYELVAQIDCLIGKDALYSAPYQGALLKEHIAKHHDARKIAKEIWEILTRQS